MFCVSSANGGSGGATPAAAPIRHRLTFLLPAALGFALLPGRHGPCLMGCLLTIGRAGLITVDGNTREQVFEQTTRFLRQLTRRHPPAPTTIAANLMSPCGRRDGWQIIIRADIAFAATGIEPHLAAAEPETAA